jgi:hypothetical protein
MAAEWIPCGNGFIEADVVRWKEGVWERRSRRRADGPPLFFARAGIGADAMNGSGGARTGKLSP